MNTLRSIKILGIISAISLVSCSKQNDTNENPVDSKKQSQEGEALTASITTVDSSGNVIAFQSADIVGPKPAQSFRRYRYGKGSIAINSLTAGRYCAEIIPAAIGQTNDIAIFSAIGNDPIYCFDHNTEQNQHQIVVKKLLADECRQYSASYIVPAFEAPKQIAQSFILKNPLDACNFSLGLNDKSTLATHPDDLEIFLSIYEDTQDSPGRSLAEAKVEDGTALAWGETRAGNYQLAGSLANFCKLGNSLRLEANKRYWMVLRLETKTNVPLYLGGERKYCNSLSSGVLPLKASSDNGRTWTDFKLPASAKSVQMFIAE